MRIKHGQGQNLVYKDKSTIQGQYGISSEGLVLWLDQYDKRTSTDTSKWEDLSGYTINGQDNEITCVHDPTVSSYYRTFDGANDYGKQKVYDTEQGNMTFVADGGTAEFRDDGQDFSDWETISGNAAYMLVVTTDNGISWAYMGDENNTGQDIDCYTDIALTTRGWKGRTTPQATPDTAASYEIRKTDFQITGDLTVLSWGKNDLSARSVLVSKFLTTGNQRAFILEYNSSGHATFTVTTDGSTIKAAIQTVDTQDDTWHQLFGVFSSSAYVKIGVNGAVKTTNTTAIPATIYDTYHPFQIGAHSTTSGKWGGEIGSIIIFSRSLSANEILRIYLKDAKRFGL